MYFYGIMSRKPTCLHRDKDTNFIIVEIKREKNEAVYELLINPLAKQDALDICMQEDSNIAQMMLEMQLVGKVGEPGNIIGKETEILHALGKTKVAKMALTLLKNLEYRSKNEFFDEIYSHSEQQVILEELQKTLGGEMCHGYIREQ